MWNWGSPEFLGIFIAFVLAVFVAVQHIVNKMFEYRALKFEQYYALMDDLIETNDTDSAINLDKKSAVVFELASFKRYYPITIRLLSGLKEEWAGNAAGERLSGEIDSTLCKIEICMMIKNAVCSYVLLMIILAAIISLMPGAV